MASLDTRVLDSLDEGLRRDIETAARILKEEGAKEVYLFGSAATGMAHADSDIDLAVRGLPPERFYHAGGQVMFAVSRSVDLIDLDEKNPFGEFLEKEGELVRVG